MPNNGLHGDSPCPTCGQVDMKIWLEGPDRFNGREKPYRLVRCPKCSLVILQDPPPPVEMGEHYGIDYDKYIGKAGDTSPERWKARKKTISQYKSSGALLDLGCSSGSFLHSMRSPRWQLFGIEMSAQAAQEARSRSNADIFVGDILDADFAPESFDLITCFDVLEHVYEPRKVMAKVREWLKPDGIFYFLVPNIDSAEARVFRSYWYGLELPRHLTHFSPDSLRTMAKSVGLDEVSLSTAKNSAFESSLHYVVDNLLHRLGKHRAPLSAGSDRGILWRIGRRALRVSAFRVARSAISLAGAGESIHAIFTKGNLLAESERESNVIQTSVR